MDEREELQALRRLAELEAKAAKPKEKPPNPTEGMSTGEKLVAGYGKAAADAYRGAKQLNGLISPFARAYNEITDLQGEIDEAKRLDAPLLKTGAGMTGNITGNVVNALPTAFVPGANTYAGSAIVGGALGAMQPTASDESRLQNMTIGAVAGPVATALGRGVNAIYQGGKALVEPFTQAGRDRIAGRVLERFADDSSKLSRVSSLPTITGARPTLAEQTGDAGIARLQDSLRSVDPQINNQISGRLAENNAARISAIQSLAGDSTKRAAAETARDAATAQAYKTATAATVEVDPALKTLLERPSVQKAIARAASLAKENGRTFSLGQPQNIPASPILDAAGKPMTPAVTVPAKVSGQTLQDLKMGMDALLKDPTSGIAGQEATAVKSTRDALVNWMETSIPEFKVARTGYAAASKPINAMDLGADIARRATSNTSDLAGNPRMQANALLGALRDEQGLIERSLGKGRGTKLSDVFNPSQLNLLKAVASETDRAAAVASAGNGPGSATAQRMASQNVLRQIIGPLGLPTSWSENALANTVVGKPLNLVYGGVAEPKIQQALAQAVLDPAQAQAVLAAAQQQGIKLPPSTLNLLAAQAARLSAPAAAVPGQR